MRSARLSPACTAAVLLITSSAAAQYQVFDGGFTSRVHGWTIWETVTAWSPNDAGDSPFSGSAGIVNTWPTGHNAMGIDQCLAGPPIVPGKSYDFGGMIYLPAGQPDGFTSVGLRWYPEAHCRGSPLEQPRAILDTPTSDFVLVQSAGNVAPAGAVSVEFTFFTTKSEDQGVVEAWFDDLYFGASGTDVLIRRPINRVTDPSLRWAVWYPVRRSGNFEQLSADEQRTVLMEHGGIGRAFRKADLAYDIRLACFGLDKNDNDFVIGLLGHELFPLSSIVERMRKTKQTSRYLTKLGPFFVGKAVWQSRLVGA